MAMKKCFPEADLQGAISLPFCKLSKIIFLKYIMPEITLIVRITSWNFVCVTKAWLWTHIQFQLEILTSSMIFAIRKFLDNILESSQNVSETTLLVPKQWLGYICGNLVCCGSGYRPLSLLWCLYSNKDNEY